MEKKQSNVIVSNGNNSSDNKQRSGVNSRTTTNNTKRTTSKVILVFTLRLLLVFVTLFNFYQTFLLDEIHTSSAASSSLFVSHNKNNDLIHGRKRKRMKRDTNKNGNKMAAANYGDAAHDKEFIIRMLYEAGIENIDLNTLRKLPTRKQINKLYFSGDPDNKKKQQKQNEPIILGLDTCQKFRDSVPLERRHIGPAGTFNTGTNLLYYYLNDHCSFPKQTGLNNKRRRKKRKQQKQSMIPKQLYRESTSILFQVPWGKHILESLRNSNIPFKYQKINEETNELTSIYKKEHTLPVIMVRDIYTWMKSMCKSNYGLQFHHNTSGHCPNVIVNSEDVHDFKFLKSKLGQTMPVKIRKTGLYSNLTFGWNSMPEFYLDFYKQYYLEQSTKDLQQQQQQTQQKRRRKRFYNNGEQEEIEEQPSSTSSSSLSLSSYPKLFVRFEDLIFYPKQVITKVCECAGGTMYFKNKTKIVEKEDETTDNESDENKYKFTYNMNSVKIGTTGHHGNLTGFMDAMIKYGTYQQDRSFRYKGYTNDDLKFVYDLFFTKDNDNNDKKTKKNDNNNNNNNIAYDFFVNKLGYKLETETI